MNFAKVGYDAYGESVDWKAYNGERMPDWDALPERIKAAWVVATDKVRGITAALAAQEAVDAGYGGVLPKGEVVDRRLHPEAMPIPKNEYMGVPEPKVP